MVTSKNQFKLRPRASDESGEKASVIARAVRFVTRDVWLIDVADMSRLRGWATRASRVLLITGRGFMRDRCVQQSAALTYLTIFTLPALLALVFSVAKGLNAFERLKHGPIDAFLARAFPEAAGEGATRIREVVDQIFSYVETADLRALGTAGVVFLLYATIKMFSSVERALNEIWGVLRSRTLVRKVSDYLALVTIAPIVLLVGTTFTGFLANHEVRSLVGDYNMSPAIVAAVPLVSICCGMTLVLLTLPNTRVQWLPAAIGGIVAGSIWQVGQLLFLEFQLGLTSANAIFAGFAAVPLLLSWIYLSWMSVFVGAELSFAIQNERTITSIARVGEFDQAFREAMAPRLAGRIAAAFFAGDPPPNSVQLSADLGVAPRAVTGVLDALVRHRLLVETLDDEDEGYLPARDPDSITVLDLLQALRVDRGAADVPSTNALDERVDRILAGFDEAARSSLFNYTLRELAELAGDSSGASDVLDADATASAIPATDSPAG